MAIKKTELYSSLWQSCDALRGGMDASQYKDYILTLLFVKYISDKYGGDEDAVIIVPEGGSFTDMVRLKNDKEIGDKINKIISKLAEENDLKGVIDVADFNDEDKLGKGKDMVDRLTSLIAIFEGLELGSNRADGDDLLGDAYEYLMRHFATESGKSKGQFYTPAEVSRILAKVVGITPDTSQDDTVYDPTCGSGSLLLKVADEAPRGLSIYGQEMDNSTAALARMNMILHDNPTAEIWQDNTLASPQWKQDGNQLMTFDFAVANPPFSYKAWSNGINLEQDEYGRFEYGTPPAKNGDYAFLLHILKSLKTTGKAAVILPHGVLFRGNAEGDIRRNLIKQGYIKGIIGLPANLFYGTGIPACIIVIDKGSPQATDIFMIDASSGFIKDGNKNRLRERDIHKIVETFTSQTTIPGYSRSVPLSEIEGNDYNLNIPRYIDSSEPEDIHDLSAHLRGGIPQRDVDALDDYWGVFPSLRQSLFGAGQRDGYLKANVSGNDVKPLILNHPEFETFKAYLLGRFDGWTETHRSRLLGLGVGSEPKPLIESLSDDLLSRFTVDRQLAGDVNKSHQQASGLHDEYAIYQLLMDYWADTMQDDVFVISQDGWEAGNVLRELVVEKGKKSKEEPDLTIGKTKYKTDLIPPALLVARYFGAEQAEIERLQGEKEALSQEIESLKEEHGGEDGLLAEATPDSGKVSKATVKKRLTALKHESPDNEGDEEKALLLKLQGLMDGESQADKSIKAAQAAQDKAVFNKYPQLTVAEIQTLMLEDKWTATLRAGVTAETQQIATGLTGRVKTLTERYAEPLPELTAQVAELSAKVDGFLQQMGVE